MSLRRQTTLFYQSMTIVMKFICAVSMIMNTPLEIN